MAVITKAHDFTPGTTIFSSSVNKNFDDIFTLQNGNLNSANLGASGVRDGNLGTSAVVNRTLADQAVTTTKLGNSAVEGSNVADGAFQFRSIDYDTIIFAQEVF